MLATIKEEVEEEEKEEEENLRPVKWVWVHLAAAAAVLKSNRLQFSAELKLFEWLFEAGKKQKRQQQERKR